MRLCGWEGNRRSRIVLALHYGRHWSNCLSVQDLRKTDHPPSVKWKYGAVEYDTFNFFYIRPW